jgi:hypothetical protein
VTDARPAPAGVDLRGLLTIDVASELRKLCQAQLQGPWQLPAELVRRALRTGATKVSVTFGRRRVVVADDGPGIDPDLMQWTAVLVDGHRDNEERHRALTTLERAGELALLALAGVDRLRELDLHSVHGQQRFTLKFRPGAPADLSRAPAIATAGTRITLRVPGLDRGKATRWLASVARFAPVPVVVDGSRVADGLTGSLVEAPLSPPLRGRVALVPRGEIARIHLLAHGLVTAHLTVPDAPCFEAAVELGTRDELDAGRLRDAIARHVPGLVDQAVGLLARVSVHVATVPEPTRARLAQLTLQAARRGLRAEEIERVAVFRSFGSQGQTLVDLAALRHSAVSDASGSPSLLSLSPGQRPGSHSLRTEPVLVAGDAERSLLAEVLGVRFRTPSRRQSSHSVAATARRLLRHALQRLADSAELLRHPLRRPSLADHVLTPGELALLSALRHELRTQRDAGVGDAVLCEGRGPLRRRRGRPPVLILPRGNPTVMACVRAFRADPGWMRLIHPALAAGTFRTRPGPRYPHEESQP